MSLPGLVPVIKDARSKILVFKIQDPRSQSTHCTSISPHKTVTFNYVVTHHAHRPSESILSSTIIVACSNEFSSLGLTYQAGRGTTGGIAVHTNEQTNRHRPAGLLVCARTFRVRAFSAAAAEDYGGWCRAQGRQQQQLFHPRTNAGQGGSERTTRFDQRSRRDDDDDDNNSTITTCTAAADLPHHSRRENFRGMSTAHNNAQLTTSWKYGVCRSRGRENTAAKMQYCTHTIQTRYYRTRVPGIILYVPK